MGLLEVHLDQQDVKGAVGILQKAPGMERRVRWGGISEGSRRCLDRWYRILLQKEASVSNW